MYLFATNDRVKERNKEYLTSTGFPVGRIAAEHNCNTAKNGSECQASCLEAFLEISKNSRVMLRRNLWVEAGLVNGSLGTITDIIYEVGRRPPSVSKVVMVKFDKYCGRNFADGAFPILPVEARWNDHGIDCTRNNFQSVLLSQLPFTRLKG